MQKIDKYPLVTIGIPTFNRSQFLKQTLQSAATQDYPNIEIIISDNASTDTTSEICTLFCANNENFKYHRHSLNCGGTENFNTVLKLATGSYFMWLGDDDWIDHNYVSECMKIFSLYTDVAVVAGNVKYYGVNDQFLYTGIKMNFLYENNKKRVSEYFLKVKHNGIFYGIMPTDLMIKSKFKNVMGGDILFMSSILFNGKGFTIDSSCAHRRRHGLSSDTKKLSKDISSSKFDYYLPRISVAKNVFYHIITDPTFYDLSKFEKFFLASKCVTNAFYRKLLSILFKNFFIEQSHI